MGVYIQLKTLNQYIPKNEWSALFDESLQLLKSKNIMGLRSDVIQYEGQPEVKRSYYSRNIEMEIDDPAKHHWDVVGDIDSLLTAESFFMYRNPSNIESNQEPDDNIDIIQALIEEVDSDDYGDYNTIFNSKTQGYPYHYILLAVGMLVEDRFPKYAIVSGDIDRYQAIEAQKIIKDILKKDVALPVVTEWERLIDRITNFRTNLKGIEAFNYIIRDDPRRDGKLRYQAIANKFSEIDFHLWILNELKEYESPNQNGSLSIFTDWLNAGFDLKTLANLTCLHKNGPQFQPEKFTTALVESLWLTTDFEIRKQFDILQKPKGEVDRVMSQFGMAMFDMMGGKGRDLKVYLAEDQLLDILENVFPDKIEQLRDIVTDDRKELTESLELSKEYLNKFCCDDDTMDEKFSLVDGTEFFTLNNEDSLSKSQKLILSGISSILNQAEKEFLKNDELAEIFINQPDINKCRFTLVQITKEYGPRLTENAWNWIDKENDFSLIKTLCVLAAMVNMNEQTLYNTKKSIFEKRWLCKLVTEWSKDSEKLESLRKMLEKEMEKNE
ncbi:hypothetical protein MHK_000639 [Candidatus Magnetomorum sp. HK-1]|nr:hypothetical protein MHK_000639 [Candidatus Magnetomorum sp. HK-1]